MRTRTDVRIERQTTRRDRLVETLKRTDDLDRRANLRLEIRDIDDRLIGLYEDREIERTAGY